jgi:hypothetical protein
MKPFNYLFNYHLNYERNAHHTIRIPVIRADVESYDSAIGMYKS